MFLSFLRFYSTLGTSLNYSEPTFVPSILTAKHGEVWRFPLLKSDLQGNKITDTELWWLKTAGDCGAIADSLLQKAGDIHYFESDKYGIIKLTIEDLQDKGFSLLVDGEVFFHSNVDTIRELYNQLVLNAYFAKVELDGDELTLYVCRDYCYKSVTIDTSYEYKALPVVQLDSDKVNCCCINKVIAEIKAPCIDGCFQLVIKNTVTNAIIAETGGIKVDAYATDTVFLNFWDDANKFNQATERLRYLFRVPAVMRHKGMVYESTERRLINGKYTRSNSKIYESYLLKMSRQPNELVKTLLAFFNFRTFYIDGKPVFLKSFVQGTITDGYSQSSFDLIDNEDILQDGLSCGMSCSESMGVVSHEGSNELVLTLESTLTSRTFAKSIYCEPENYAVRIQNNTLNDFSYKVYKNDVLSTLLFGTILSKSSSILALDICNCDNIKIVTNETTC
jgi:hypothetical protein